MLNKVAVRLLVINACLTTVILLIFSSTVYCSVVSHLDQEIKRRLWSLSDAVIDTYTSFNDTKGSGKPPSIAEILNSSAPEEDESVSTGEALEWFSEAPSLVAVTGSLKLNVPFNPQAQFEEQEDDHALILTRAVTKKGKLYGYLRTAVSLEDEDDFKSQLVTGLLLGSLSAMAVSSFGIVVLVRQFLKPIEDNLRRLGQFTSDVSHELRSPLTAVKSNASVALRHSEGMRPGDRDKFQKILDAADQMIKTTGDLLSLAQAQERLVYSDLPEVDLGLLAEEVCKSHEAMAAAKGLKLEYSCPKGLMVGGRSAELKRVIINLLENAIQYTEKGTVSLHVARHGGRVEMEVIDSGIGIAEDELPLVFDRFWRSDKARTHRSGGNGLGLAIAKAVVEAHGGNIAVRNGANKKGTVFSFVLPVSQQDSQQNQQQSSRPEA